MSSLVWLQVKPHGWPGHCFWGKGWTKHDCIVLKLGWLEAFCNAHVSAFKELGVLQLLILYEFVPQSFTYQIIDKCI